MRFGNVELHNTWSTVVRDGGGLRLCRFPQEILDEINPGAKRQSFSGAGCEIRGMLPPGGEARIVLECLDENVVPPIAETFFGDFYDGSVLLGDGPVEIVIEPGHLGVMADIARERKLPFDATLVRVKLPHIHEVCIHAVEGDLVYPERGSTPGVTMLSYGSSITHGAHALRPSGTYAAQAARALGCDLVNLGVGGSAHMDAALAWHIAERADWDFATLEMGINVGTWSPDQFRDAVDHFLSTIVAAHPGKPVFCIDVFTFRGDFFKDPAHNGTEFRGIVRDIVRKQSSEKVIYVDGRGILTDPTGLRPDLVHPGDDGMHEMGRNLAKQIRASGKVGGLS